MLVASPLDREPEVIVWGFGQLVQEKPPRFNRVRLRRGGSEDVAPFQGHLLQVVQVEQVF